VARSFGLEHPIDASTEDVVARVREESEGRGADAVLLAVGGNALIRTAMDAVRPGGRVMLFAQTQHGEATFDPAAVCMDEKTLMGSYSSSAEIQEEGVRMVIDGYQDGYDLTRLISHRFPLSRAAEAIEFASRPHPDSMKIMIEPGN
jgi:L-iditol 2-dehydrogenase